MGNTEQHGPLRITQVDEGDEEGIDIDFVEDVDINLRIRRELIPLELDEDAEKQRAQLIVEGDIQSVDIAFVILTQALEVPGEDIADAIERGRNGE